MDRSFRLRINKSPQTKDHIRYFPACCPFYRYVYVNYSFQNNQCNGQLTTVVQHITSIESCTHSSLDVCKLVSLNSQGASIITGNESGRVNAAHDMTREDDIRNFQSLSYRSKIVHFNRTCHISYAVMIHPLPLKDTTSKSIKITHQTNCTTPSR
jgi:hypothetical protein